MDGGRPADTLGRGQQRAVCERSLIAADKAAGETRTMPSPDSSTMLEASVRVWNPTAGRVCRLRARFQIAVRFLCRGPQKGDPPWNLTARHLCGLRSCFWIAERSGCGPARCSHSRFGTSRPDSYGPMLDRSSVRPCGKYQSQYNNRAVADLTWNSFVTRTVGTGSFAASGDLDAKLQYD